MGFDELIEWVAGGGLVMLWLAPVLYGGVILLVATGLVWVACLLGWDPESGWSGWLSPRGRRPK